MHDEGVIKYSCDWQPQPLPPSEAIQTLIGWRDRLFAAGLIGVYPDGVGFGNISLRQTPHSFWVSGTQTGHLATTTPEHYTLVDSWDIEQNHLHCSGPIKASSESLTHAALYDADDAIQAIVHVHAPELWQRYRNVLPTTRAEIPYGTPAMAHEMARLLRQSDLPQRRILVMGGHEDGLLSFGESLSVAAIALLKLAEQSPPAPFKNPCEAP